MATPGGVMRIGIVVDAACDLPVQYLQQHRVVVLPIRIHLDGQTLLDQRDAAAIAQFLDAGLGDRGHAAETEPCSVEEISALFLERLVIDYDCVFCLTISATRSGIHANTSQASFAILKDYRPIRQAAGVPGPFLMRVIDTENLFAAQGITAVEAVRLRAAGEHPGQIREQLELLSRQTFGYMLPRDLYYLRARAQKKGDRSVGWVSAALGTALDIKPIVRAHRGDTGPVGKVRGFEHGCELLFGNAARAVRSGLLTPTVCVSYGGDPAQLPALPGYTALRETCAEHEVELFASPMSITGMVNVGTGAVLVAFAAHAHEFSMTP